MSDGFDLILSRFDEYIGKLARRTRALITDVYPRIVEVPWPNQNVIGYGVGPRKMSEHFCYIAVHRDHVNLGFNYGAELPDPTHVLAGPGKLLRHVKITAPADLDNPALRQLLEAASTHRMPVQPAESDAAGGGEDGGSIGKDIQERSCVTDVDQEGV
jgi:hypothetical protein